MEKVLCLSNEAKITLQYKELSELKIEKYSGKNKLEDYTIETKIRWKDFCKESYCEINIKALISSPINKLIDSCYKIGYDIKNGPLEEEDFKALSLTLLDDFNYLFMTITQQMTGDYISHIPKVDIDSWFED